MKIDSQDILSLTDEDWSEMIAEIGYPKIPITLAEKRKVYVCYLTGDVIGNHRLIQEEVTI